MVLNTTGWALLLPYFEQNAAYELYNFGLCSSASKPNSPLPLAGGR